MKQLVINLGLVLGLSLTLTACHTVAGAGQDLQAGGHAITNTAQETSKKM